MYRVEKLVRVPGGGERAGFGLSISDYAGDNEVGVIEGRPISMGDGITELATLVNRTRSFRSRSGCRRGMRTA
jgi:hypothetical protein